MLTVKRFTSFDDCKNIWQELEKNTSYYPFQAFWYQRLFAEKFCNAKDLHLLGVFDADTPLALGGFERIDTKVVFLGMKQVLGDQDLSDYGDLLFRSGLTEEQIKEIWLEVVLYFKNHTILRLQLDFVREDSQTYTCFQNKKNSAIHITQQEVAPYIILPSTWEDYLAKLSRSDRHELKRKIKRLERDHAFHFCTNETMRQDFEEFVRLHRLSDPSKEKFMSESMKIFFWELAVTDKENYRIDFCFLSIDGKKTASIMSFFDKEKRLLYNSGFDPEYKYFSVGLILHAYLIKKTIKENIRVHDFLRGAERYKYDLGAKDQNLYKISIDLISKDMLQWHI